jgi:hypothetical protein
MSLWNQDDEPFSAIDRHCPQVVSWCQDCDFYNCGPLSINVVTGEQEMTDCTSSSWPQFLDGTPIGVAIKRGRITGIRPLQLYFAESPYFHCKKRSLLRWTATRVMERIQEGV